MKTLRNTLLVLLCVFAIVSVAVLTGNVSARPLLDALSAPDGVTIDASSALPPVHPIRWDVGDGSGPEIYGAHDGTVYLSGGASGNGVLQITPGDQDTQNVAIHAWANTRGLTIYDDRAVESGNLSVGGNLAVDEIGATGDINAAGNITGANLSGTNTGDQTFTAPIWGNGANGTVSTTAYLGPGAYDAPTTSDYDVTWMAVADCNLNTLYFRTRSTQPATGALHVYVRINGTNSGISITVAAGAGAGLFSDLANTAQISKGSRMSLYLVNDATSASAKIASWSLGCTQQ